MIEESLNDIQKASLKILKDVVAFCEKYNISYFLIYGTLLGAARHKGFIPWDDDIDIGMDLRNFKKFNKLAPKYFDSNYFILNYQTDSKALYQWTKVQLKNTTAIDENARKLHMHWGIGLDVFLFSGLSNNKYGKKLQNKSISCLIPLLRKHYWIAINKKLNKKEKRIIRIVPEHFRKYTIKLLYWLSYRKMDGKKQCFSCYDKQLKKCVLFQTQHFEPKEFIKIQFEDEYYNAPKYYNEILTTRYGDWEVIPPQNERIMHDNKIYDLNKNYTEYLL